MLKSMLAYWLMPLPFCAATMIVGLVMLRGKCCARAGRWIFGAGFLLLLLFGNGYVSRWLIRPLETKYAAIPELAFGAALPPALADADSEAWASLPNPFPVFPAAGEAEEEELAAST